MSGERARYGIEELASLGGVSRRTVRYYVQEGLLPPPLGVGRGDHYSSEHLERLLKVKALQERGLSLDDVRRELGRPRGASAVEVSGVSPVRAAAPRSAWTRLEVAPGLEIHVSGRYRLPSSARLEELVDWCRRHFGERVSGEE